MDILKSLARLGVGAVSAVLLALALVAMSLARAFRSGMITIKPELFVQMAATAIAIVALWKLLSGEFKVASRLGTMALAGFLLANFSVRLPGTWGLGETAIKEADNANARHADALEVARVVPGTSPRFTKDGTPRYCWSPSDEKPVFYDRCGIHPDKGTPLSPVDSDELFTMILRKQAEAKQAAAIPPPVPAPVAEAPAAEAPPPQVVVAAQEASAPVRISAKPLRQPDTESVNPQSLIDWRERGKQ